MRGNPYEMGRCLGRGRARKVGERGMEERKEGRRTDKEREEPWMVVGGGGGGEEPWEVKDKVEREWREGTFGGGGGREIAAFLLCPRRAVNAQQVDTYQLKSLDGQFGALANVIDREVEGGRGSINQ